MSDRRRHPQELSRRGVTVGLGVTGRTASPPASDVHRAISRDVDAARDATTACHTREIRLPLFSATAGMVIR